MATARILCATLVVVASARLAAQGTAADSAMGALSSNVVNAHKLQGSLLSLVGALDENVDPSSTL
ncbi:MAG: hypothetical protein ABJF01_15740 [bacterium]